jgi:hypothetical protein
VSFIFFFGFSSIYAFSAALLSSKGFYLFGDAFKLPSLTFPQSSQSAICSSKKAEKLPIAGIPMISGYLSLDISSAFISISSNF